MQLPGRWAFLGLYLVGGLGRFLTTWRALLPPSPSHQHYQLVPVCPMQSKCELKGSLPRHTKPCLSLVSKTCHEKWGELIALSDPAHLRQFQGAHTLTSRLCTQAGIKKAEDSNPVHHQKHHVISYFGAGFPLSLKELKEPRARTGLEETRCFSESCWHTVYKNTLTGKKEGDGKKGTVR